MLADTSLVATNKSYFSKLTGMTEANILAEKFILPKNIWGPPETSQNYTHFSGTTNALSSLFGSVNVFVADSRTGEFNTANDAKYVSIQETFVGKTLTFKKLNERLWIYNMVDFLNTPILRDNNAIHAKFTKILLYTCFEKMKSFTL